VPAVITLAVTSLRLVGELQRWSPTLFNRGDKPFSPSLVGIAWLVPVFGAWFGWKLALAGSGPRSLGRAFGLTLAALAVLPLAGLFLAPKAGIVPEHLWRPNVPLTESLTILSVFVVVFFVGIAIGILAWQALGRTLLAYGLAVRIPIALLMLVAMLGNWGTHYDARPSYPQMSTLGWWVAIGLLPQLSFWIWITIVFGALSGIVAAAIARRRGTAAS